ncbi:proteoglycan 4-like [Ylistrum balloti]|uniref:proteoglycan 4-like n=1 Tax=Ylistrum balloti TaxID=509963 RepID=UPI0029059908|nr:proteoglycan 4-like [Ylistrum balloti]
MRKLLIISLIIGTALAQAGSERKRIALLRRRQQIENLSEQEQINGGFLPSGTSRLPDSFRGLEATSFDIFSRRRRRFRPNVEITNKESLRPRRRDYLLSLRSSLRRIGGRTADVRDRRTYMPAIKRPRFTPNLREILPRRTPSYSPTARGIDSNWTPRLPTTVLGSGNFLPSNLNDYIERTNPVNDRSYVSPKKPSLLVEPIPLPPPLGPTRISAKDPVAPLSVKPDYVEPKSPVLPLPTEENYVASKDPVLLPTKPDYVEPKDPVLLPTKPDYVAPKDPVLLPTKPDYVAPKDPVLLPTKPDYVAPKDPVLLPTKPDYVESKDPVLLPNKPDYVAPKEPVLLPTKPDYVAPKELGPVLLPNEPGYVAPKDPVLLPNEPGYVAPKDPVLLPNEPGYVAPKGPVLLPNEPGYVAPTGPVLLPNEPGYVAPKDPILLPNEPGYVAPKDPILLPNEPGYVAPKGPNTDAPKIPFGPLDPLNIPPLPATGPILDPLSGLSTGPLDTSILPLDVNDPNYVDPAVSFDPLSPSNIPLLPTNIKDPNNVPDSLFTGSSDLLDLPTLPLSANDPVNPSEFPVWPNNPKVPTNVKDPNYVADNLFTGPLDPPTLPVKDSSYIEPKLTDAPGPLDFSSIQVPAIPNLPIKDPNYVEPSVKGNAGPIEALPIGPLNPVGPSVNINSPDFVGPLTIDALNPLGPLAPLTPIDLLDTSAVSPSNKPGYIPPNDAFINSIGSTGDPQRGPFDPNFADPLSISPDAFLEPLMPTGGLMSGPSSHLTSSKSFDPNYVPATEPQVPIFGEQLNIFDSPVATTKAEYVEPAVTDVSKPTSKVISSNEKTTKGSGTFGPSDMPQDNIGIRGPFSLLSSDNMSPVSVDSFPVPDIPALSGPTDPLTEFGSTGGLNDPLLNPLGFQPEPSLPESPLFDISLPPLPDLPEPVIPGQVLTRGEINEAARREYAKSADAFDPKWNNPNVRNSDLYVQAKEVDPKDVRPSKIKTLFDLTDGDAGADIVNKAVNKVSEKTESIMTDKMKKREGYLTKYDALRSYEGVSIHSYRF